MTDNYARIVGDNLGKLYGSLPVDLADKLPGNQDGDVFEFSAFGDTCRIGPDAIVLGDEEEWGVLGILISLYALNASAEPSVLEPLKAYKDFPDSMPYVGAFASHTERVLVPHVDRIETRRPRINAVLPIRDAAALAGGDFSFLVTPLPKITLCYIFYQADEDFPASATCLFSSNANQFLPLDALADVGEYTSKKILSLISEEN